MQIEPGYRLWAVSQCNNKSTDLRTITRSPYIRSIISVLAIIEAAIETEEFCIYRPVYKCFHFAIRFDKLEEFYRTIKYVDVV
jgi:hypothetical protein